MDREILIQSKVTYATNLDVLFLNIQPNLKGLNFGIYQFIVLCFPLKLKIKMENRLPLYSIRKLACNEHDQAPFLKIQDKQLLSLICLLIHSILISPFWPWIQQKTIDKQLLGKVKQYPRPQSGNSLLITQGLYYKEKIKSRKRLTVHSHS